MVAAAVRDMERVAAARGCELAHIERLAAIDEEIRAVFASAQDVNAVVDENAVAPNSKENLFVVAIVLDAVNGGADFKHDGIKSFLAWPCVAQPNCGVVLWRGG